MGSIMASFKGKATHEGLMQQEYPPGHGRTLISSMYPQVLSYPFEELLVLPIVIIIQEGAMLVPTTALSREKEEEAFTGKGHCSSFCAPAQSLCWILIFGTRLSTGTWALFRGTWWGSSRL